MSRCNALQSKIKKTVKKMKINALTAGASHAQAVLIFFAARKPTHSPHPLKASVANASKAVIQDFPPENCGDLANNPIAKQAKTAMRRLRLVSFIGW